MNISHIFCSARFIL